MEDIKVYFAEFKQYKEKQAIKDNTVFNFNETSFQIRVVFKEVVIILINYKAVYAVDPNNKELVTSIKTINCSSRKVFVIIIFKGVHHLQKHFTNDIDSNTFFMYSLTGFLNNKLRLKNLEYFNRFIKDYIKGVYYILIFNGYRFYLSQLFINYYWEYRI